VPPFSPRRALAFVSILALSAPAIAGCAVTPRTPIILAALTCGPLIPQSYRKPVPPADLPPPDATAGDVYAALDGQTAALDQANGRTADVIAIAEACDKRQAEVMEAVAPKRPGWWPF
jgi:hypothetical protein